MQRLTDTLHVPDELTTVRIEVAHNGAALCIITERGPVRKAAVSRRWTAARQIRTEEPRIFNAGLVPPYRAALGIDHTHSLTALGIAAVRKRRGEEARVRYDRRTAAKAVGHRQVNACLIPKRIAARRAQRTYCRAASVIATRGPRPNRQT